MSDTRPLLLEITRLETRVHELERELGRVRTVAGQERAAAEAARESAARAWRIAFKDTWRAPGTREGTDPC